MKYSPKNNNTNTTINWKIACPIMCLNIVLDMMYSFLECGFRYSNYSVGDSVAKAKDANVSIIKFIHNI